VTTFRQLLAVSLFLLSGACAAQPPFGHLERITGTLNLPDGAICSATAISRKALITATHCLGSVKGDIRFRGVNYTVLRIENDGQDHSIVVVDADLGAYAKRGRAAKRGERVWMIGNPMGLPQLLREGLVAKVDEEGITFLDCRCWQGGSGMGIFNANGQLVGVFNGAMVDRGPIGDIRYTFPVYLPFAFTAEQWKAAK
jgi:S1-C subfamily serine protease